MLSPDTRNGILIAALEAEDAVNDVYILPGNQKTFRVAYCQSHWAAGNKVRKAVLEWVHYDKYTMFSVDPLLSPKKYWKVYNQKSNSRYRAECEEIMVEVATYINNDFQ